MFIGEIILQRRKELGMTQKELSEKLNVTDRTVSRWECGVNLPDVEMLKSIAIVLDVEIKYFYEDVKEKEINQVEEYDYDKIKKYKIGLISPFVLVSVSILMTLILKYIMLELTSELALFSNVQSMINHAFAAGIVNNVAIIMVLLMVSLIISIISYTLFLKTSIAFEYFYKQKMYQKIYRNINKKTKIIYYILFTLSILFIFI